MVDPLSAAGTIIALVSTASKGCKTIFTFIDRIQRSEREVSALSDDLKAFYTVLATLRTVLEDDEISTGLSHPLASEDLEKTISNSIEVLQQLSTEINRLFAPQDQNLKEMHMGSKSVKTLKSMSTKKRITYSLKEADILSLRSQLAQNKKTLNIAISVANFINTSCTQTTTRRIERDLKELKSTLSNFLSGPHTSDLSRLDEGIISNDHTFCLRRYLNQTPSNASNISFPATNTPSFQVSTIEIDSSSENVTFYTAQSQAERRRLTSRKEASTSNSTLLGSQLFVKGLSPTTHVLHLETALSNLTTHDVLEKLAAELDIPQNRIMLRCNGKVLYPGKLAKYGILNNSTLFGTLRPGGCDSGHESKSSSVRILALPPSVQSSTSSRSTLHEASNLSVSHDGRLILQDGEEILRRKFYVSFLEKVTRSKKEADILWSHCCGEEFVYAHQLLGHTAICGVRCSGDVCMDCHPELACSHEEYLAIARWDF
ncbi:hypothetical protein BCR34DRAFT_552674 [Clohesyomyces aquaticus]|uniref:Azaphilone pigments biosynthesis cluster protein L N-terminal domain-containing protein n=1 Tax=Clohesyomyces aquaticus TaxID=1231657 RepID=A0A1Y2A9I5_9PLEO|nr:hypothetical protein BCR34DRAFT_552674 [Clohesyomyces aquaticus]